MRLLSWLRPLLARRNRNPARTRRAPQRPAFRPRLEALEDRLTPSGGGLLDTTFNGTGTEALPSATSNRANAVAIQPDGKIVAVGNVTTNGTAAISVVRMNSNGALDTTFNGSGSVILKAGTGAYGNAVALQPDGKVLVGGEAQVTKFNQSDWEYVVARLNADGSLDKTFGNSRGMWLSNPTNGRDEVLKLAVLTDTANHVTGILAGGTIGGGFQSSYQSFAAIKLTAAGLPDTAFGSSGIAAANVGAANNFPRGMAVTPTGGVVLVGLVSLSAAIVEFTPSGQLDTTFNGTGSRVDNFAAAGGVTRYDAVAIQPVAGGGFGIVVAGNVNQPTGELSSGLVTRYTASGQLDATFGSGGLFLTSAAGEFHDLALEADGSLVVAGYAWYTNPNGEARRQMAVGHLSANGAADTTFGTAGTGISVVAPLDPLNGDDAYSLALGSDGKILVAGKTGAGSTMKATFARFTAP